MDPTTNTDNTTNIDNTTNTNPEVRLVDVQIIDENTALNVIVSFLSLAQKRGSFTFDESAKIWECIQLFQKPKNL